MCQVIRRRTSTVLGEPSRAGRSGEALTILLESEIYKLKRVVEKLRCAKSSHDSSVPSEGKSTQLTRNRVLQRKVNEAGYFGLYDMDRAEYADENSLKLKLESNSVEYLVSMSRKESVEWRKIVYSVAKGKI